MYILEVCSARVGVVIPIVSGSMELKSTISLSVSEKV